MITHPPRAAFRIAGRPGMDRPAASIVTSHLDSQLTPEERGVLALYRAGDATGMARAVRLSVGYALGAGVFVALALHRGEPLLVLPVYAVLLLVLAIRLVRGRRIAGRMPAVVAKYEAEIGRLGAGDARPPRRAAGDPGPREVVATWVEAFNRADVEALASLYTRDAVNHQVAREPVAGRDAIRAMFARELAAADMTCLVENLFTDGDWAILEWRDPGGLRGCGFFHVVDGRIRFQRGYWDERTFLRQQGSSPPAG